MSSIGIPELDSSDTKLCRSSLGVQDTGSIPAAATTRRKALRTFAGSSGVPVVVENTRSNSSSWRPLSALCFSTRQRCFVRASTQRAGNSSVRRDLLVFVSLCARTDLQRLMVGGLPSRLTRDQVNAPSSSVRAPVSSETTTYAFMVGLSAAALSSLSACSRVKDLDGRPGCPFGRSHNSATLRLTRSRARGEGALSEWGYRRLAEIPGPVQVVDCFVNSQRVGAVVDQATTEKDRLGIEAVASARRARAQAIVRPGEECRRLKQCLMTPGTHVIFQC
jgi:hypothetical protein